MTRRGRRTWKISRDTALLLVGAVWGTHEVFFTAVDRPSIIAACVALMCSPVVLRYDERRRENGSRDHPTTEDS
jgi:hypothetical protein